MLLGLALTSAGCTSVGGQIDVLGLPRKTESGTTSNRNRIYERHPTPPAPAPTQPPATPPSSP
jgi:hypothetical protein